MAPGWQFVAGRCELIECLLLKMREPRFYDRPYRAVLDLFVAHCAVTYLLQQMESSFFVNHRQSQFGIPSGQAVESNDPLLDIVRPVRKGTATSNHFLGQEFGSPFIRRCIELCA